jgi:hypothetical protein
MTKIKCDYCGRPNNSEREDCRACGAPLPMGEAADYWPRFAVTGPDAENVIIEKNTVITTNTTDTTTTDCCYIGPGDCCYIGPGPASLVNWRICSDHT